MPGPSLTDLHRRLHDATREMLLTSVEALMSLDVEGARDRFAAFQDRLEEHMEVEDELFIPRYEATGRAEGAGLPEHVESDHLVMTRHLERCTAALEALSASDPNLRRAVLMGLDPFLKLLGALDHHTEREQRHMYPILDDAVPPDEREPLAAALRVHVGET